MDNNNFENVTNAAEPVAEAAETVAQAAEPVAEAAAQAAEPVAEAAETVAQAAEPVAEAAATAAGAEAGTMPVYTDYSSYDSGETKQGINVLGLVAMILGIVAFVLMLCGCCVGTATVFSAVIKYFIIFVRIVASIAAIILGIIGMKKRPDSKGMAIAGLILGILGLLLGILSIVLAIAGTVLNTALNSFTNTTEFQNYLEELQDSLESY